MTQDNPAIYPNVPLDSGHRLDLLTFAKYAGGIAGRPQGQDWADWNTPASRGWVAQGVGQDDAGGIAPWDGSEENNRRETPVGHEVLDDPSSERVPDNHGRNAGEAS